MSGGVISPCSSRVEAKNEIELALDSAGRCLNACLQLDQSHGGDRCGRADRVRQQQKHDSRFEEADDLIVQHLHVSFGCAPDFMDLSSSSNIGWSIKSVYRHINRALIRLLSYLFYSI